MVNFWKIAADEEQNRINPKSTLQKMHFFYNPFLFRKWRFYPHYWITTFSQPSNTLNIHQTSNSFTNNLKSGVHRDIPPRKRNRSDITPQLFLWGQMGVIRIGAQFSLKAHSGEDTSVTKGHGLIYEDRTTLKGEDQRGMGRPYK